jgi:hypothetical protein
MGTRMRADRALEADVAPHVGIHCRDMGAIVQRITAADRVAHMREHGAGGANEGAEALREGRTESKGLESLVAHLGLRTVWQRW